MFNSIKGTVITPELFTCLECVDTFLYYDQPLLYSAIDTSTNEMYIVAWADLSDDNVNRWAVYPVSDSDLNDYKAGAKSLHELVKINTQIALYDIYYDAVIKSMLVDTEVYLEYAGPAETSFYGADESPNQSQM